MFVSFVRKNMLGHAAAGPREANGEYEVEAIVAERLKTNLCRTVSAILSCVHRSTVYRAVLLL